MNPAPVYLPGKVKVKDRATMGHLGNPNDRKDPSYRWGVVRWKRSSYDLTVYVPVPTSYHATRAMARMVARSAPVH